MKEFDVVIRGGTIVDGTGIPRYRGDLAIKDGRVARISGRIPAGAAKEIDASGCIVAPGAIDLHTHYDAQLNWDPTPRFPAGSGSLPDHRAVRLRLRTHPSRGPGTQHAHDESHRGDSAGIHAARDALGLGDFSRVPGQPGQPGARR